MSATDPRKQGERPVCWKCEDDIPHVICIESELRAAEIRERELAQKQGAPDVSADHRSKAGDAMSEMERRLRAALNYWDELSRHEDEHADDRSTDELAPLESDTATLDALRRFGIELAQTAQNMLDVERESADPAATPDSECGCRDDHTSWCPLYTVTGEPKEPAQ